MGTPIKNYLIWCNIERNVMKSFLHLFNTDYPNIRVQTNNVRRVKVDELINEEAWKDLLREHFELLDRFEESGLKGNFDDLDYWKTEYCNAPKGIKNSFVFRRINELYSLYKSIKDKGYIQEKKKLVKAIWIENLIRRRKIKYGSRVTEKYYRLNGVRRLIICKYRNIEEIPISLIKVKVVKL